MVISIFFLISSLLMLLFNPEVLALHPGDGFAVLYQLLTHMFAHANWGHLLGNYIFVAPYAFYLEHKMGARKFINTWITCGLMSVVFQLGFSVISGDMAAGMIGSSGAAFGIVAAALVLADMNIYAKIAARTLLAYHIGTQIMYAYMTATNPMFAFFVHIAFAAHLGGILCGTYLGYKHLKGKHGKRSSPRSSKSHKAV